MGGFHLAPAPEDYLRQIMAELNKFNLEHIMPMHCSGQNFVDLAQKEMPEKLVLCGTGSSFTYRLARRHRRWWSTNNLQLVSEEARTPGMGNGRCPPTAANFPTIQDGPQSTPTRSKKALFDHLVGASEQQGRQL